VECLSVLCPHFFVVRSILYQYGPYLFCTALMFFLPFFFCGMTRKTEGRGGTRYKPVVCSKAWNLLLGTGYVH
jgi:hypothetical protein